MKRSLASFLFFAVLHCTIVQAKRPSRPKTCRLKRLGLSLQAQGPQNPITTYPTSAPIPPTGTTKTTGTSTTKIQGPQSPGVDVVQRQRFPYGQQVIRGVNLGGWLVLEPWITPSVFINTGNEAIIDEYTYGLYQDRAVATKRLQEHWDSWITEQDFAAIQAAGLNHVRIPFPFWGIPTRNTTTDPFITGSWPWLLKGVAWASKYSISVIIDIHCAPGSQNGFDNSGQYRQYPGWHTAPQNVQRTLEGFKVLLEEFSQPKWGGTVGAIEALNEPAGFYEEVLTVANQYWRDSYNILRDLRARRGTEKDPNEIKMVIMDGFRGVEHYNGFLTPPNTEGVIMDTHSYQLFNPDQDIMSDDDHIRLSCSRGLDFLKYSTTNLWTFVGEWTSSPTDCTRWINGRGRGSDWLKAAPGRDCSTRTGHWQTWAPEFRAFLSRYFESQASAFERAQGWIYWTWKTEDVDEWSYSKGIEGGWIPRNIADKTQWKHPNICG